MKRITRAGISLVVIAMLTSLCVLSPSATAQDRSDPPDRTQSVQLLQAQRPDDSRCQEVIKTGTITKGDPREASPAPTPGPSLETIEPERCDETAPPGSFSRVIQLGDSYSAGVGSLEGDPPVEFGQHVCPDHQYYRDEITPGIRLAHDLGIEAVFAACSGTLADSQKPGMSFSDQIQLLVDAGYASGGGTGTLIVYSLGGNDLSNNGLDWVGTITNCLLPQTDQAMCDPVPAPAAFEAVAERMVDAHELVRATFPNATVRVMGYPILMNRASASCEIGPLEADGVEFGLSLADTVADEMDAVNQTLNATLAQAVADVASATSYDIDFVSPSDLTRPGACQHQSADAHVQPWILNGSDFSVNSFHPTETGYQAMYEDLADNLGFPYEPLDTGFSPPTGCNGGTVSKSADPWGDRIGHGAAVRWVGDVDSVLNGKLLPDTEQTIAVMVDMLGEPLLSADTSLVVQVPGALFPVEVDLEPFCYQGDTGADRGFYLGTADLRTNEPFTSLVAQLTDASGALVASGHAAIASVERIEAENTLETVAVRLNDSALNELEELAEHELRLLFSDALRTVDVVGEIWVAEIEVVNVGLAPLAPSADLPNGGLRASVFLDDINLVVRAPYGKFNCNWLVSQNFGLLAQVDLSFTGTASGPVPLSLAGIEIGFPGFNVSIDNFATDPIEFCLANATQWGVNFAAQLPNAVLNDVLAGIEATEDLWLDPVNEALAQAMGTAIDDVTEGLDESLGFDVTEAVTIGTLEADGTGVSTTVAVTLPGGPVPDDGPDQALSTSASMTTAQGSAFDAAVFVELAALNRVLALGTKPLYLQEAPLGDYVEVDYDDDGDDERLAVALTTAPYLTRGDTAGEACGTLCVEGNVGPLRVSVFENQGGWTWDRDLLLHAGNPAVVTDVSMAGDNSFAIDWTFDAVVTASVLAAADGSTAVAGAPAEWWAIVAEDQAETSEEIDYPFFGVLPLAAPGDIENISIELTNPQIDVAGNTDLQLLLDLDFSLPAPTETECDGLAPTHILTPYDDVAIFGAGQQVVLGLDGNDAIAGGSGDDVICGGNGSSILDGEQHDDRLFGGPESDFIRGGWGDDTAWTSGGADWLFGDAGKDWLDGASGDDFIYGNDGDDRGLIGGDGVDRILGGTGDDYLRGDDGNDTLIGGPESDIPLAESDKDRIEGSDGHDTIDGGTDNDTIFGDTPGDPSHWGYDIIDGQDGNDFIYGGPGDDTLTGGDNNIKPWQNDRDWIWGDAGVDTIRGGADDDWVFAGSGADIVYGGSGGDRIYGGSDNDELYGNSGKDYLYGQGGSNDYGHGGSNWFDYCDVEIPVSC